MVKVPGDCSLVLMRGVPSEESHFKSGMHRLLHESRMQAEFREECPEIYFTTKSELPEYWIGSISSHEYVCLRCEPKS